MLQIPDNLAADGLGTTILEAWQQYSQPEYVAAVEFWHPSNFLELSWNFGLFYYPTWGEKNMLTKCFVPRLCLWGNGKIRMEMSSSNSVLMWHLHSFINSRCSSVILFIIRDGETNIYDQRYIEYAIRERNSKVKVIRRTLKDLHRVILTDDKRLLMLVSVYSLKWDKEYTELR